MEIRGIKGSASLSVQIALVWQDHPGANRDPAPPAPEDLSEFVDTNYAVNSINTSGIDL
jgi:hypothetical protein